MKFHLRASIKNKLFRASIKNKLFRAPIKNKLRRASIKNKLRRSDLSIATAERLICSSIGATSESTGRSSGATDNINNAESIDRSSLSGLLKLPPAENRWLSIGRASLALFLIIAFAAISAVRAQVLGDPIDVSQDFWKMENVYFIGSKVASFDPATGKGALVWDRYL